MVTDASKLCADRCANCPCHAPLPARARARNAWRAQGGRVSPPPRRHRLGHRVQVATQRTLCTRRNAVCLASLWRAPPSPGVYRYTLPFVCPDLQLYRVRVHTNS